MAEDAGNGAGTERPNLLRKALLVDETQIDRAILERQLKSFGLTVASCRSVAEAAQATSDGARFDVVLINSGSQGDSENLRVVRADGALAPVLLLSSDGSPAAQIRPDIAAVLQKPILRSQLHRVLQDLSYPVEEAAVAPPPRTVADEARVMRVLAAEDNRTNQLVLSKMVAGCDIELRFANNGREAVELWQSLRPDLIFMDISMPEMDGRDAARAIRAQEEANGLPRVPIVALTAHAMVGDQDAILAAGIDQHLTKPLKKAAITARIAEFCPPDARPAVAPGNPG